MSQKTKSEFERLLDESFEKRKSIEPGSEWTGKVTSIKNDYLFLRAAGLVGNLSTEEFRDSIPPKIGSEIKVYFLKEEYGDYYFTTCLTGEGITSDSLGIAVSSHIPILGQIASETKGGYEVRLGSFHGFVPHSQMDLDTKGKSLLGQKFKFLVTEVQSKTSKVILSQRRYVERERIAKQRILEEELKVGSFLSCKVKSIHKFGLIVGVDGFDALIPQVEATYKRNADLSKEFQIGEMIRAKVLQLDWQSKKITLSAKEFLADPWAQSVPFQEGDIVSGKVESLKPFGIFVRLSDSFGGLVPNKETGLPPRTPTSQNFHPGQAVEVYVVEVNPEKKQISLSIAKAKDAKERLEFQAYLKTEGETPTLSSFGLALKKSLEKNKKN